jgi:protein-glutamine gamma-glutamyltransferase
MKQNLNTSRLSLYFSIIAVIIAGMVGLGHGSWNLPLLVLICCICGSNFTDRLGWIVFPKWFVYIAMISGAGLAVFSYMSDPSSNQILAVGNLLIFVQIPLIFQAKSKRVFEHWGVFLLLELVVAALVNDNVLFGVLMLPLLGVGCGVLIALALYASQLRHSESISESTGWWARFLHWIGKESLVSRRGSGVALSGAGTISWSNTERQNRFSPLRWLHSVLPISFAVLFFAIVYFYSLPRLNFGAYEGSGNSTANIGFSDQVSLRYVGNLLQNETPAFRMSMRNLKTNESFKPGRPPYIRVTSSRKYYPGASRGFWRAGDAVLTEDRRSSHALPSETDVLSIVKSGVDQVEIDIVEKISFGAFVPTISPVSKMGGQSDFRVISNDWTLLDFRPSARSSNRKRKYSLRSYGFALGYDSPILSEWEDILREKEIDPTERALPILDPNSDPELTEFPNSLSAILPVRDKILETEKAEAADKMTQAFAIEKYLKSGSEYSYTLSLTSQMDKRIDPIVDFLVNKKRGHCQYFGSALALTLRSLDIPTRIVVGFRPSEYNEVGKYFLVKQNDAHVWVEAYFSKEELESHAMAPPSWIKRGAWIRLDPTPEGSGSNAGGSLHASKGQTLDAMQDLWNEMVLSMDKSKQSTILSVFGETSGESYSTIWQEVQSMILSMQSNRLVGGLLSPDRWFSWQVALIVSACLGTILISFRWLNQWLPSWMTGWPLLGRRDHLTHIDFYDRLVRSLRRLGFVRSFNQTPKEFIESTSLKLSELPTGIALDAELLSSLFYERRFGGLSDLSAEDRSKIQLQTQMLDSLPRPSTSYSFFSRKPSQ